MNFFAKFDVTKTKVNLKQGASRLKLLGNKKSALSKAARREIATLLGFNILNIYIYYYYYLFL